MSKDPSELWERDDVRSARRVARERWPLLLLLVIALLAFVTRISGWENYIAQDGTVQFGGNDGWYHYRQVKYTVQNWPTTMPFDPWSGYPTGTSQGQFGTLFDQIIATVALIIGLGSPSDTTIRLVLLFTPPVFGMLTVFPTYYVATRLSGDRRVVGVLAALFLAMFPGTFFTRTLVGSPDHNAAEPFFMLLTVAAFIAMVRALDNDPLVLELFQDGADNIPLTPVRQAVLFGVAFGLFMWLWPPAVAFGGIMLLAFGLYGLRTFDAPNEAPEPVFVGTAIASSVTFLMVLPFSALGSFSPTSLSIAHLGTLVGIIVTTLGFVAVSRLYESRDIPSWVVPLSVVALVTVTVTIVRVAAPSTFSFVAGNVISVFGLGFGGGPAVISEAQALIETGQPVVFLLTSYGFLFAIAQLGLFATVYNGLASRDNAVFVFVGVLGLLVQMMAFSQIRFNYYAAPMIAIFAAYTIDYVVQLLEIPSTLSDVKGFQILVVLTLVAIIVPFVLVPVAGSATVFASSPNADAEYQTWKPTLEWMNDNTPEEGRLKNPNGTTLPYYGTFEKVSDYEYPDGTYGVMSWWDYGHWITATAERIPVANPFQQHAPSAAKYLLAPSEEEAQQAMDDIDAEGQTRYVVVNWEMATVTSEFPAITVFHPNQSYGDFSQRVFARQGLGQQVSTVTTYRTQRYYESLQTRLYYYHGSRVPESTLTFSIQQRNGVAIATETGQNFTTFHQNATVAERAAATQAGEVQGGVGIFAPEPVPALEHYRLVRASEGRATSSPRYRAALRRQGQATGLRSNAFNPYPANVKVFERVDGATIQGTGPANETVTARVTMETHYGQQFVYLQEVETDADGSFTLTVPYSTTGYDNWGPEDGYTNVSTRAATDYQLTAVTGNGNETTVWSASTDVPEAKVIGEDTEPVTVTLQKEENDSDETTSNTTTTP